MELDVWKKAIKLDHSLMRNRSQYWEKDNTHSKFNGMMEYWDLWDYVDASRTTACEPGASTSDVGYSLVSQFEVISMHMASSWVPVTEGQGKGQLSKNT